MKLFSMVLILALISMPCMAQVTKKASTPAKEPSAFIWMGIGASGYHKSDSNGLAGYGSHIGTGKYLLSNLVITGTESTLSEAFVQKITEQGPVMLFSLGEIGINTGNNATRLALAGGGGVMLDILKFASPKWKDFRLAAAVKITKPTDDPNSAVVRPQFIGGLVYIFGSK